MALSERDLHEAGIVTLRRRLNLPAVGGDRELGHLLVRIAELQKAVAQRDALLNLYQQRVEALSEELTSGQYRPFVKRWLQHLVNLASKLG